MVPKVCMIDPFSPKPHGIFMIPMKTITKNLWCHIIQYNISITNNNLQEIPKISEWFAMKHQHTTIMCGSLAAPVLTSPKSRRQLLLAHLKVNHWSMWTPRGYKFRGIVHGISCILTFNVNGFKRIWPPHMLFISTYHFSRGTTMDIDHRDTIGSNSYII